MADHRRPQPARRPLTQLELVTFDSPGFPPEDIAERDAIFDSIQIEP